MGSRFKSRLILVKYFKENNLKILVPVKRVVDYNVKVRVKNDNSGVELDNVSFEA